MLGVYSHSVKEKFAPKIVFFVILIHIYIFESYHSASKSFIAVKLRGLNFLEYKTS